MLPKTSGALAALCLRWQAFALLRLGRHDRACSAFTAFLSRRPEDAAALKGLAEAHSARGDWASALANWETAVGVAPQDCSIELGRARCLLQLTRAEEAHAALESLAQRHPRRADVLGSLLEAAWRLNDHASVADAAQRLWRSNRAPLAAQRLVSALALLGRIDEADAFIREVEADAAPRALVLRLKILRFRATYQWKQLAELLHANRAQATNDEDALGEEIDCLLILGRGKALRELLDASPPRYKALTRPNMLLAMAQAYGRPRLRQTLLPMLRPPQLWKLPGSALPCAVAASDTEDQALLSEALQQLEAEPQRCKDGLLPLMAPLAATLHESLLALRGAAPWPPPLTPVEARLQQVLCRSGRGYGGAQRLRDFAARLQALRATEQALHLHVSCRFDNALAVADLIVQAVQLKKPLSVLRLGDGEGAFLPCPPAFRHLRGADQTHMFRAWWNQSAVAQEIRFLEQAMEAAVADADIVGIPDLEQLVRQVQNLSDTRLAAAGPQMMRGYVSALEHVLGMAEASPGDRTLTSSHFHEAFITWRLWAPVLQRAGSCSLITCHSALAAHLERSFGIRVRHTRLLPPEAKWSDAFAETGSGRHYPDRFNELRDTLDVLPGELHLVAAGVLGKIYCQWIKAAGGVAVDIGSVADHWCGYRTRYSISALQSIMPVTEADYLHLAAKDARIARIFGTA